MELPSEFFVRPVPNSDDLIAFQIPIQLEAKALEDGSPGEIVEILEDGDLIIEGYAAEFEGLDRQKENFAEGAFARGLKSFIDGSASLCFHHKKEKILGKVLALEEDPKGLRIRARVDGAIKNHPELGVVYQQIKKGTLSALSVQGYFKRKLTEAGRKIVDMDFVEISVTPTPVHAKTAFAVVAGKALEDMPEDAPVETPDEDWGPISEALDSLTRTFEMIEGGKAVKGDPQDNYFLALLLELEQMSNHLATAEETEGDLGEGGGPTDAKVDALVTKVRDELDQSAREAHKLAAKLGPLPKISYV